MSSLLLPQLLASAGRRSAPTAVAGPSAAVLRRAFGASAPRPSFHFDTQTFIERLEREGLSRQQATGVMGALAEVIDESVTNMSAGMVPRSEQEKQSYAQSVDFTTLKSELQLLESQDFALMRTENERLLSEVEKLKQSLKEQIVRTQAGVRLDLNLEKGRIRDEASLHELKIKEVDTRIESEIAGLRTQIQGAKFSILQYMVTVATGGGALLLAYMRFIR